MNQKKATLQHLAAHGESSGKDLRDALTDAGVQTTTVSFYGAMARLESGGYVTGDRRIVSERGLSLREKFYTITQQGREYLEAVK